MADTSRIKTTLTRVEARGRTAAEVAKRYGVSSASVKKKGNLFILPKTASLSRGMGTRSTTAIDRASSADKARAARYETGTAAQKGQSAIVFRRYTKKLGGKFGPGMAIQGIGKPGSPKMKALAERARAGGYTRNYKQEAEIMKQQASSRLRGEGGGMRSLRGWSRGEFPGGGSPKVGQIVRGGSVKVTGKTAEQKVKESGKAVTTGYGRKNKPSKSGYGRTKRRQYFVRTGRGKK
jgi:hypothetical protein